MKIDGVDLLDDSEISRELVSSRGATFPVAPTNAQKYQLTAPEGEYVPGIYIYSSNAAMWVLQEDEERNPYDISVTIVGRPKPDAVVANSIAVRTFVFYSNFEISQAVAIDAATDETVFTIRIVDANGDVDRTLGTVTFAAGAKVGVFSPTIPNEPMLVSKGEIVSVKAPELRDATLKEISISIAGQLAILND
ncbi:hypothetical protein BN7874_118 [Phage NCTB]|jgi:hypothetical protein|nr:hypothetical protein BN7874_118 [Phage NCTB]